jgi:hypothetical protein
LDEKIFQEEECSELPKAEMRGIVLWDIFLGCAKSHPGSTPGDDIVDLPT